MVTFTEILVFLFVGGLAGWLAGLLVRGHGYGILANILIGIVGAVLGGWLLTAVGVGTGAGMLGVFVTAFVGAAVLLLVTGLVGRATRS